MKRLCILLLILVFISCSRPVTSSNISGDISVEGEIVPQTFYAGLYNLSRFSIGEPIQFLELTKGSFSFDVPPGQYTLVVYLLETGTTPDFDVIGDTMVPVQEYMEKLTAEDREAIAAFLETLPPRPNAVHASKTRSGKRMVR